MILEDTPNVYSVWIVLISTVGPVIAGVVTAWVNSKLNKIHTLVNGNLDTEKRKNAKFRKQLEDAGIKPEE